MIGSDIAVLTEALCVFLKKKCIWMGNGYCNLLAKLFLIILQKLDNNAEELVCLVVKKKGVPDIIGI